MTLFELLCAAIMLLGLVGVVIQVLPGTVIVVAGVLLWATELQRPVWWWVLAIAVVAVAAAQARAPRAPVTMPARRVK